jgi:hypothetical protein
MTPNHSSRPLGGSYADLRKSYQGAGNAIQIHHMPAYGAYEGVAPINKNQGACIAMTTADHQKTASWGNGKNPKSYRDEQKQLITTGKIGAAFQMDKADLKSKFGTKYNRGVSQAESYLHRELMPKLQATSTASTPQTLKDLKQNIDPKHSIPSTSLDQKLAHLKAASPQAQNSSPSSKPSPHPNRNR